MKLLTTTLFLLVVAAQAAKAEVRFDSEPLLATNASEAAQSYGPNEHFDRVLAEDAAEVKAGALDQTVSRQRQELATQQESTVAGQIEDLVLENLQRMTRNQTLF